MEHAPLTSIQRFCSVLALLALMTALVWMAGCKRQASEEAGAQAASAGAGPAGERPAMSDEDMGAGAMGGPGAQGPGGGPGGPGFAFAEPEPGDVTVVMGNAESWDAEAGLLVVAPMFGGEEQQGTQVHLGEGVPFLRLEDCQTSDLAEGDMLSAMGQVTALDAERLHTAPEEFASTILQGGGRRGGRGGQGQSGGYSFGSTVGEIVSTTPLRIKVSDEITAEVGLADDAACQRMVESDEPPTAEEMVVCQGEVGDDGSITADFVLVTAAPPRGMGGPGGGSGPGGPRGGGPGA